VAAVSVGAEPRRPSPLAPPAGHDGDASAPARVVTVVGAGAGNLKGTVALNLAAALAALGRRVALHEHDGAAAAALGASAPARVPLPRAPYGAAAVELALYGADDVPSAPGGIVVVDPPPRLDARTRAAVAAAHVVIVPVDASPLALRVLADVAATVQAVAASPAPRLRVVLARLVPRSADRWSLVERVAEVAPGALFHATLPMARRAGRDAGRGGGAPAVGGAVLYAPGTRAAAAYRALAVELLAALDGDAPT
jgi:chromosome partitioning protein